MPIPGYHPVARLFRGLCDTAGLEHRVRLFYAPANRFNAFTVGHGDDSVVVLNRSILEHFSNGEMAISTRIPIRSREWSDSGLINAITARNHLLGSGKQSASDFCRTSLSQNSFASFMLAKGPVWTL